MTRVIVNKINNSKAQKFLLIIVIRKIINYSFLSASKLQQQQFMQTTTIMFSELVLEIQISF